MLIVCLFSKKMSTLLMISVWNKRQKITEYISWVIVCANKIRRKLPVGKLFNAFKTLFYKNYNFLTLDFSTLRPLKNGIKNFSEKRCKGSIPWLRNSYRPLPRHEPAHEWINRKWVVPCEIIVFALWSERTPAVAIHDPTLFRACKIGKWFLFRGSWMSW